MFARQLKFLRETFFLEEKLCQSLGEVGSARSSSTLGQPTGLFPLQMPTSTQVRMLQFKAYTQYTAGYILPAGPQLHYIESFLNSKIPPRMLYLEWEILQLSKAAATMFQYKMHLIRNILFHHLPGYSQLRLRNCLHSNRLWRPGRHWRRVNDC